MHPSAKLTSDREKPPKSNNRPVHNKTLLRDVVPKVSRKPRESRSLDYNNESWGNEELHENDDTSDLDATPAPELEPASISFGALARAQASLARGDGNGKPREAPLPVSTHKASTSAKPNDPSAETLERGNRTKEHRQHPRLSKHAPAELSSKKAISRKRPVVPVPKRDIRDPRFENALGPINEQKIKSNYAFLEDYRESEMKTLKAELKKTKSDSERENLKKDIMRKESRKGAQDRKVAEQEVLRRHRKEERAKVQMGKAPFYLKKAQVKKEALVDRYGKMKPKEVDKLIERRRKKKASRDKKHTPQERRSGTV